MEANNFFWNDYASDFDAIYGKENTMINNVINRLFRKCMKIRFEKTIQIIPKEKVSIIDIGCGPGHYCFTLAQNEQRDIFGIDFSEKMIQLAKYHAKKLDLENKIQFENSNFLEFTPKKNFDYCIMMGFIEYFDCPEMILKKACSMTNRKILVSFPVEGGILAFQRKLRYKRRCFLRMYRYRDIRTLLEQLNINSYTIEKIDRDFFVTITLN